MNVGAVLPFTPDTNAVCSIEPSGMTLTAGNIPTSLVQTDSTVLIRQYNPTTFATAAVPIDTAVTVLRISGSYRTAN
jgi:hypothetical protein